MKKLSINYPPSQEDLDKSALYDKEYKANTLETIMEQVKLENYKPFSLREFKAPSQFLQFKELMVRA